MNSALQNYALTPSILPQSMRILEVHKIDPYFLYIAAPAHCLHGCRYLGFVGNEIPPCIRGTTARDGGSVDIAGAIYRPTARDGGSVDIAGEIYRPTAMDGESVDLAGANIDHDILSIALLYIAYMDVGT